MTIQTYLEKLCQHCGIESESLTITVGEVEDRLEITIEVPEEDSGLLIGFHGETLSAIQRLTRVVFQEELADKRLVLNINNYREQRMEKLQDMARKAAERVLETGHHHVFSFLPANERYIIHTTLADDPEFSQLESISEGEGRDRVLVIRLKNTTE